VESNFKFWCATSSSMLDRSSNGRDSIDVTMFVDVENQSSQKRESDLLYVN